MPKKEQLPKKASKNATDNRFKARHRRAETFGGGGDQPPPPPPPPPPPSSEN